ncbi:MAG TPA: hypothetical protein VGA78_10600 [Gemmatimonadales bacterium]
MRPGLLALAALLSAAGAAQAQDDCRPGPESNEAQTLGIFSVPLAFSPAGAPGPGSGRVRFALEASYLPEVDPETATPTICRPGKGPENTDLLIGFLRPRVVLRVGNHVAIDAAWVPPIRVNGVKANLVGLAVGWSTDLGQSVSLGLRAHMTLGQVNAPITCSEEALLDPLSECFEGTESDDRYQPNIYGADATFGFRAAGGRIRPYLGAGYNRLVPRFQVNFVNRLGELDNRRVFVDLNRAVVFGGLAWQAGSRFSLVGEIYSAPADATTGRVVLSVGQSVSRSVDQ